MPVLRAGPALAVCNQDLPKPFCLQSEMAALENFGCISGCKQQSGSHQGKSLANSSAAALSLWKAAYHSHSLSFSRSWSWFSEPTVSCYGVEGWDLYAEPRLKSSCTACSSIIPTQPCPRPTSEPRGAAVLSCLHWALAAWRSAFDCACEDLLLTRAPRSGKAVVWRPCLQRRHASVAAQLVSHKLQCQPMTPHLTGQRTHSSGVTSEKCLKIINLRCTMHTACSVWSLRDNASILVASQTSLDSLHSLVLPSTRWIFVTLHLASCIACTCGVFFYV